MPSDRDPRKEPRAGDVLRNKAWFRPLRYVVWVQGSIVGYVIRRGSTSVHTCSLASPKACGNWQRWAANAEVIHRAD